MFAQAPQMLDTYMRISSYMNQQERHEREARKAEKEITIQDYLTSRRMEALKEVDPKYDSALDELRAELLRSQINNSKTSRLSKQALDKAKLDNYTDTARASIAKPYRDQQIRNEKYLQATKIQDAKYLRATKTQDAKYLREANSKAVDALRESKEHLALIKSMTNLDYSPIYGKGKDFKPVPSTLTTTGPTGRALYAVNLNPDYGRIKTLHDKFEASKKKIARQKAQYIKVGGITDSEWKRLDAELIPDLYTAPYESLRDTLNTELYWANKRHKIAKLALSYIQDGTTSYEEAWRMASAYADANPGIFKVDDSSKLPAHLGIMK